MLNKITVKLKNGNEHFLNTNTAATLSVIDFWRWSASDLVSNTMRGILAEFIVASALGIDVTTCREEWAAYDLITPDGIKIEVKSCAYLQSWHQKDFSKISFGTKAALGFDAEANVYAGDAKRHADVYVFCLLRHKEKVTINPLDMAQWEFYILATQELDGYKRSQHSITLKSLQALTPAVDYSQIREHVQAKYIATR